MTWISINCKGEVNGWFGEVEAITKNKVQWHNWF